MKNIVILTGAGISVESGIQTFRGQHGLWNGYDIEKVASPEGWKSDPELVLDFYNKRRQELKTVQPNKAHYALAELENHHAVSIVTQNVDDLHERAGSTDVIHLHGELLKARSEVNSNLIIPWDKNLNLGDLGPDKKQLRPHIVWFGEAVPLMDKAIKTVSEADLLIIIGTSLQVYPAANLMHFCPDDCDIYYIDPQPSEVASKRIHIIPQKATLGIPKLINTLKLKH